MQDPREVLAFCRLRYFDKNPRLVLINTDFGMAPARLLGFDLCPRFSHLRDRRLHVPQHHRVPAELLSVADRDFAWI